MVEIAVALIIMGLLAAVLGPTLVSSIRQERVEAGNASLEAMADGIIGYAMLDSLHRLPATVALVGEDADAWNRPYHYLADSALTGGTDDVCTSVSSAGVDDLQVVLDNETVEHVAFVIASDGGDGSEDIIYAAGSPTVIDLRSRRDDLFAIMTLNRFKALVCAQGVPGAASTEPEPPSGWILRLEFEDTDQGSGDLVNGAEVVEVDGVITGAETPDGYALSLDGVDDYWEVPQSALYRLEEFTITGWFRTWNTTVGYYEPITSRQSSTGHHEQRNWWITLWTNDTSQGHVPGELVFKASPRIGNTHFNYDTEAQTRVGVPRHHDAQWHFFAATMGELAATPGDYQSILYVSEDITQPLHTGTQTLDTPPDVGPPNGARIYNFYVGRDTYNNRFFGGLIDDLIVWDHALTPAEIEQWYEDTRNYYR